MFADIVFSVIKNKCPRCHKGNVFYDQNPYNLRQMYKMHGTCSICGLRYEKEPGYFYGAMYVSYALTAGWFVLWFILQLFLLELELLYFVIFLAVSILLLSPLSFRWSRLLWINLFVKYDPSSSGLSSKHTDKKEDKA